jgi:hypothetical protein
MSTHVQMLCVFFLGVVFGAGGMFVLFARRLFR